MTGTCGTNDMKMVPLRRQNVTVASLATKVTLRRCRGECLDDIDIALKYDVRVDANGPLAWGTDGAALAAGENGPYESTTMNVVGSGGHPNAQRYGVFGGKAALTLPLDLETADDYRILVHEESTGLTCRSDYFTIANAGEIPTPQPFYACCRAEIEQSLPVARLHAGPRGSDYGSSTCTHHERRPRSEYAVATVLIPRDHAVTEKLLRRHKPVPAPTRGSCVHNSDLR